MRRSGRWEARCSVRQAGVSGVRTEWSASGVAGIQQVVVEWEYSGVDQVCEVIKKSRGVSTGPTERMRGRAIGSPARIAFAETTKPRICCYFRGQHSEAEEDNARHMFR